MKKLLITTLLALNLIGCAPIKKGEIFDYREKYKYCKLESMMERGTTIGAIYDLNENGKIDHLTFYDLTRKDSIINYAPTIIKLKKEVSLEEWNLQIMNKKNIDYFLFDNDNNGTLEIKTKPERK